MNVFFMWICEGFSRGKKCAYSAAKVLLCMRSRSTSPGLCTRKALWPEGIKWRVFLLEPYPIWKGGGD